MFARNSVAGSPHIEVRLKTTVEEIKDRSIIIQKEGRFEEIPVANVVLAMGMRNNNDLAEELKTEGKIEELYVVGDCNLPNSGNTCCRCSRRSASGRRNGDDTGRRASAAVGTSRISARRGLRGTAPVRDVRERDRGRGAAGEGTGHGWSHHNPLSYVVGHPLRDDAEGYRRLESAPRRLGAADRLQPAGCFIARFDGRDVGTVTTTAYDGRFGWVGMVLVHPDARRKGVGTALLMHGIRYLETKGVAAVKLDATPTGKKLYQTIGFTDEYLLERRQGMGETIYCVP